MSGPNRGLPAGYEACREVSGQNDVVFQSAAKAELHAHLTTDQRAELLDLLARFALRGAEGLPPMKFDKAVNWRPGRARRGEPDLVAVKTTGVHVYGIVCGVMGRRALVITGVDQRRKNDNAGRALKAAAGAEAIRVKALLEGEGDNREAVAEPRRRGLR